MSARNTAQTAQLVAYDSTTRTVVAKSSPVPGAHSISSIAIGPNGHVYGVAGSTLFEADPRTLTVIRTKAFYTQDIPGTVVFLRSQLIASVAGKIYTLTADDFHETQVATGARLAVNSRGQYYYVRDGALYRMTGVPSAVAPTAAVTSNASGFALTTADVKLGASMLGLIAMLIAIPVFTLHHRRIDYVVRR